MPNLGTGGSSLEAGVNDSRQVKLWSFFPTKEDFKHGVFVVHEPSRCVYDGRYGLYRRRQLKPKVLTVGFVVEGGYAKMFANSLALQMGVPVSMQPNDAEH